MRGIVMESRYAVNAPDVVNETIDGEVIMINMRSGNYYSLDKVGADVWSCVEKGLPVDVVVAELCRLYGADPIAARAGLDAFFHQLAAEGLVRPAGEHDAAPAEFSLPDEPARGAFTPPVLEKYDELQDLLLADPIHDVDANGWPNKPADA